METTPRFTPVTVPSAAQLYALERAAQQERAQVIAQLARAGFGGLKRLATRLFKVKARPAKARPARREVSHA